MRGRKKKYSDDFKIRLAEESINKLTLNHTYFPKISCKTIYNSVCDLYGDLEYSDINCPAVKGVLRKYQEERNQNIDITNWAPYTKPAALKTFDAKEFYLMHQNDMEKALIGLGEQINGLLNQYAATQNKCKQITKELDANKKDAMKTEKQIRIEQKQLRSENRELKEELKRYKKEFEELELAAAQMVLADSNQANLIIEDNAMARAKTYLGTNFEQRKKNNLKLLRRDENG